VRPHVKQFASGAKLVLALPQPLIAPPQIVELLERDLDASFHPGRVGGYFDFDFIVGHQSFPLRIFGNSLQTVWKNDQPQLQGC
jgi:hypothetical protein